MRLKDRDHMQQQIAEIGRVERRQPLLVTRIKRRPRRARRKRGDRWDRGGSVL
jgi:hypothetical protein